MPGQDDCGLQADRLAEARRRLYMPDASERDLAAVLELEATAATGEQSLDDGSADVADVADIEDVADVEEIEGADVSVAERPTRTRRAAAASWVMGLILLLALGTAVVVAQQPSRSTASAAAIPLRVLVTRFPSVLPSEWQGAAVVAARESVRGPIALDVTTSAETRRQFLVLRCSTADGRWSVRSPGTARRPPFALSGSCAQLGLSPVPAGAGVLDAEVGGRLPFAILLLAHS